LKTGHHFLGTPNLFSGATPMDVAPVVPTVVAPGTSCPLPCPLDLPRGPMPASVGPRHEKILRRSRLMWRSAAQMHPEAPRFFAGSYAGAISGWDGVLRSA
jgi:hypothetical protein